MEIDLTRGWYQCQDRLNMKSRFAPGLTVGLMCRRALIQQQVYCYLQIERRFCDIVIKLSTFWAENWQSTTDLNLFYLYIMYFTVLKKLIIRCVVSNVVKLANYCTKHLVKGWSIFNFENRSLEAVQMYFVSCYNIFFLNYILMSVKCY